jgi:hypothetical protein
MKGGADGIGRVIRIQSVETLPFVWHAVRTSLHAYYTNVEVYINGRIP